MISFPFLLPSLLPMSTLDALIAPWQWILTGFVRVSAAFLHRGFGQKGTRKELLLSSHIVYMFMVLGAGAKWITFYPSSSARVGISSLIHRSSHVAAD